MNRTEWSLVAVLMLLTALTLSFASPGAGHEAALIPVLSSTATATVRPTSTETATPSPSRRVTKTATPTRRPSATPTPTATLSPTPSATRTCTPFPFDTRPDLSRYIYVDQGTQRVCLFEEGTLVRDVPCSTGLPDDEKYTPAWSGAVGEYWGTFFAYQVYVDEAWYLFKSEGSILVHSLPYTLENESKVYQDRDAPGVRPASHGCIRISPEDAFWFTSWRPEGVPMTISDPHREKWRSLVGDRDR